MQLELVPLLQYQRELYAMPQGYERFKSYLDTMLNPDRTDVDLAPLVIINPMGKPHLADYLETLLALEAETITAQTLAVVEKTLTAVPGSFRVGLAIADDLLGGWTNRYTSEFSLRFTPQTLYKRSWLSVTLWASEPPSADLIRQAVLEAVYRAAYWQQHSHPKTLAEMMAQAGYAMAQAGRQTPTLSPEDLDYTREVVAPYLNATDQPTLIACLFGDAAAHELGYPPQGLSDRAGLALALYEARHPRQPKIKTDAE
ncbi:MAG: hypothetical protein AAGF01_23855 [Cyanobacteria bacterium P01_G01_bin.38]